MTNDAFRIRTLLSLGIFVIRTSSFVIRTIIEYKKFEANGDSMSVVIRMKKMGRKHRQFFRICATDPRNPRDGRVIEEIGTYDPHVPETDARVTFNDERLQHWLGVGAKPSERVAVLIKKYGPTGTHKQAQTSAREKLAAPKAIPDPGA